MSERRRVRGAPQDPLGAVRRGLRIDPGTQVGVLCTLVPQRDGTQAVPCADPWCAPCVEVLEYQPQERLWVCPGCGYELTQDEGRLVLARAREGLEHFAVALGEPRVSLPPVAAPSPREEPKMRSTGWASLLDRVRGALR